VREWCGGLPVDLVMAVVADIKFIG
jgi:hypothetical protein